MLPLPPALSLLSFPPTSSLLLPLPLLLGHEGALSLQLPLAGGLDALLLLGGRAACVAPQHGVPEGRDTTWFHRVPTIITSFLRGYLAFYFDAPT